MIEYFFIIYLPFDSRKSSLYMVSLIQNNQYSKGVRVMFLSLFTNKLEIKDIIHSSIETFVSRLESSI